MNLVSIQEPIVLVLVPRTEMLSKRLLTSTSPRTSLNQGIVLLRTVIKEGPGIWWPIFLV